MRWYCDVSVSVPLTKYCQLCMNKEVPLPLFVCRSCRHSRVSWVKSLCLRVKIHYQTPMWVTGDSRFRLKCDFGLKCSAKKGGGGVRHWCLKEVVSSVGVWRRWCEALVSNDESMAPPGTVKLPTLILEPYSTALTFFPQSLFFLKALFISFQSLNHFFLTTTLLAFLAWMLVFVFSSSSFHSHPYLPSPSGSGSLEKTKHVAFSPPCNFTVASSKRFCVACQQNTKIYIITRIISQLLKLFLICFHLNWQP